MLSVERRRRISSRVQAIGNAGQCMIRRKEVRRGNDLTVDGFFIDLVVTLVLVDLIAEAFSGILDRDQLVLFIDLVAGRGQCWITWIDCTTAMR